MRRWLLLAVGLLPASRSKNRLLRCLGHVVHATARIEPSVFVGVDRIELGEGARIGFMNGFRRLTLLRLDRNAAIGTLNWVSAAPFLVVTADPADAGQFRMGIEASLTQRHYLDASGGITLGSFSTVAGVRSVFLTHEIDTSTNRLVVGPLTVGAYSLVSSNTTMLMGTAVPDRSLVAMGATVTRGLTRPGRLYAGVPARDKGPIDGDFFHRTSGKVGVDSPAEESRPRERRW